MLDTFVDIPLFQGFSERQIHLLTPLFQPYACPEDTMLFEQGSKAEYLYMLLQGTVEVRYKPYDGPPIVLTRLKAGDVVGWSAVIGSPAYTSGARSTSPVEALRIRGRDLEWLCREHPNTGSTILDRLAQVVSLRWKNARAQVKTMLREGVGAYKVHGS
ncbi:MAG: Crp/Fnr family transcriptional regulator [Chloroflexota bacterium]